MAANVGAIVPVLYQISVIDPQQHGEGRKMYTSYGLDVAVNGKHASGTTIIRRRYSDFQWLANRLQVERPGAIIPLFPHKRALTQEARFNEALIKERRAALETFLQQVVTHPEIVTAGGDAGGNIPPCLKAFLFTYETPETFEEARKELEKAHPNPNGGGSGDDHSTTSGSGDDLSDRPPDNMGERFRNLLARSVVTASLLSGQQDVLETTEHEHDIEMTIQYIEGAATFIKELANTCTALVKSTTDRASSLDTFADAIFGWCLAHRERFCPNTTNPTVEAFRKVNEFIKYVSKAEHKKADQELEQLEQSLQDLSRRIQAIQKALASRKEYQVRYTARVQQVNSRKTALSKALANPRLSEKITPLQIEVATAQAQADKAQQALVVVSERVLREMNRVQHGLDDQLRTAIANYAKLQVQHCQLMQDGWTKFIPHVVPPPTTLAAGATSSLPPPPPPMNSNGSNTPPPTSAFLPNPSASKPTATVAADATESSATDAAAESSNDLDLEESSNLDNDSVAATKAQVIVGV